MSVYHKINFHLLNETIYENSENLVIIAQFTSQPNYVLEYFDTENTIIMYKFQVFFLNIKNGMDMLRDNVLYQELIGEFQFRIRMSIQIALKSITSFKSVIIFCKIYLYVKRHRQLVDSVRYRSVLL